MKNQALINSGPAEEYEFGAWREGPLTALTTNLRWVTGAWIPLLYAILLLFLLPLHFRFDEWGGVMQYFAGKELLAGNGYSGWTSLFWPPLFSFLIGVGSTIMTGFLAGKLISIFAATSLLYVSYCLAMELTNRPAIALLTQVFLALTPPYLRESLQAHNHMLDAALFVTGILFFLKAVRRTSTGALCLSGLVCGLASLARYTSTILLLLPLFLILLYGRNLKRACKLAVCFWVAFILICLPWWCYNTMKNGSPLHTGEAFNVCSQVAFGVMGGGSLINLWRCANRYNFNSILDIFLAFPHEYLRNIYQNVLESLMMLVRLPPNVMALFVLPGFLDSVVWMKREHVIVLFGQLALFLAAAWQAFVPEYALLPWAPLVTIMTVMFIWSYFSRVEGAFPKLRRYHTRNIFIMSTIIVGIAVLPSTASNTNYWSASAGLTDLMEVTKALKDHDPVIANKVVMAVDPARAYYAGSRYLATPTEYKGTVAGMVSYSGLNERVKDYAPKYPTTMCNEDLRADYLIYTRTPEGLSAYEAPIELPQFSFLLDPHSEAIPNNFNCIYRAKNVVVYEINW